MRAPVKLLPISVEESRRMSILAGNHVPLFVRPLPSLPCPELLGRS